MSYSRLWTKHLLRITSRLSLWVNIPPQILYPTTRVLLCDLQLSIPLSVIRALARIPSNSPRNTPELSTHCAFSSRVEFLTWLWGPHLNHLPFKHRPLSFLLPRSTSPNSSALSQLPLLNDHFPTWSQVYPPPISLLALKSKHISSSSPFILQKLSLFGLRKLTVGISANRESQKNVHDCIIYSSTPENQLGELLSPLNVIAQPKRNLFTDESELDFYFLLFCYKKMWFFEYFSFKCVYLRAFFLHRVK